MSRPTLAVLGASNVARGFPALVNNARRLWGEPLELFVAKGHGRSYGITSRLLGRSLPGIRESGLFQALRAAPCHRLHALVTDIGNDLPYGVPVEQISSWVTESFDYLTDCGARVAVLPLPIDSLRAVPRWKYVAMLRLLYPACRTQHCEMLAQAKALNDSISCSAKQRGIQILQQDPRWYGFDPIHIRRRQVNEVWSRLLEAMFYGSSDGGPASGATIRSRRLQRLRPHRFHFFGREFQTAQPSGQFPDGTRIHLY